MSGFSENWVRLCRVTPKRLRGYLKRQFKRMIMKAPIISDLVARDNMLEKEIVELRMLLLKQYSSEWNEEVDYILQNGPFRNPYKRCREVGVVETGYDCQCKLPYVIHKGKRLYFTSGCSRKRCVEIYRMMIEFDGIIGGRYWEKQPHQYQSDTFKIEEGDVLVDVGCAEGLVALDVIDKVSKAYLFESNPKWIPALKATFKDYGDKVKIFNKFVSNIDSDSTITLKSALNDVEGNIFVKMDIEGAEVDVLTGSKEFLKDRHNVKLAVCTYHRQKDEEEILALFKEMGYQHEFSDGWFYFKGYDKEHRFPYFRHGVIRGWK